MIIHVKSEGNKKIFEPEGRLDTNAAVDFGATLEKEVTAEVKELIIDMDKCPYVASSGLRVILQAQKTMQKQQGEMIIRNVNEVVMEVFEMTGFCDILNIEE